MATQATAVWRVRKAGNAANGAGYDPGISGAGTDYSQQDSPQLSLADVACSNTTTVTSATGGFTAAMIGSAMRVSGGGATAGYYWITARASSTSITVDRSPGTVSGGTGKVGGGANLPSTLASAVVPGNVAYILGSAGNASSYPTSSLDYTEPSFFTPTSGDTTSGWVKWVADPAGPMPTIGSPGLSFYNASWQWWEGLYVVGTSGANGGNGMLNAVSGSINGCILNTNSQSGLIGAVVGQGWARDCEFYGGTTAPTRSAGAHLIKPGNYGLAIVGCTLRYGLDCGVSDTGGAGFVLSDCLIYKCAGNGVEYAGSTVPCAVLGCTIDGNGGHGIALGASSPVASVMCSRILNNVISNHTGTGKAGISVASGSAALNNSLKLCDYNDLYNNTSNYSNISAGAHDLALNPQYTNASGGDYSVGTNLRAKGFPGTIRGSSTTSYVDMGTAQRQEPAGGGPAYYSY